MKKSRKSANPFYVLLVLVGITFVVTATAFCVMTSRALAAGGVASAEHPLMAWMDKHGMTAMLVELALLGVFTIGAIGTDQFWQRRAATRHKAATAGRAKNIP
jgi:predicted PurR-regulated permease PerM